MFNFIVGCSTIKNVSVDDIRNTEISKVVLATNEEIEFEEGSAKFDNEQRLFTGITVNGETFEADSSYIQSVEISKVGLNEQSGQLFDYWSFLKNANKIKPKSIYGAILKDGSKIRFQKPGGVINFKNNVLSGNLNDSTHISTNLQDIDQLHKKQFSATKTAGFAMLCSIAGFLALGAVVQIFDIELIPGM